MPISTARDRGSRLRSAARFIAGSLALARSRAGSRAHAIAWSSALLAAFGALTAFRLALTVGAFRNSDDASNFLAGVEMAEGNWSLHGWTLAVDNYYPTEVLGQALLRLCLGYHPVLMKGLEALVWAAIGLAGTGLAALGARTRQLPGRISIALALLVFNVFEHRFQDAFLSGIASHGFTILLALLAFGLIATAKDLPAPSHPRSEFGRTALLGGIVTIGSFADPVFNVIACLPILAASLAGLRVQGCHRRPALQAGATVGGMVLAHALLVALAHNGGFRTAGFPLALATLPELAEHLAFAAQSTIRLLGAAFFGRVLDHRIAGTPYIYLLRVPFVLGFAAVCWSVGRDTLVRLRDWPGGRAMERGEELDQLLWFSLVLCVASAVVTTIITDQSCARFFIPSTVMGSILVARRFGRLPLTALYGGVAMLASLAVSIASIPPGSPRSTITIAEVLRAADVLERHDLRHGYAGFWEGAITTAVSHRRITSLALIGQDDGRLHTFNWFCNLDWYRRAARDWHGRTFFITAREAGPLELSQDMVVRQFGPPLETFDLGKFAIDVYDVAGSELSSLVP